MTRHFPLKLCNYDHNYYFLILDKILWAVEKIFYIQYFGYNNYFLVIIIMNCNGSQRKCCNSVESLAAWTAPLQENNSHGEWILS